MSFRSSIVLRFMAVIAAVLASAMVDVSDAYAQSSNCSQLASTLRTLERNGDFRNAQASEGELRALGDAVQRAESTYVREGCNDAAKRGQQLTRECRALARRILSGRADYEELARSVETGNAIAQQREAVLQEYARFGCGEGSTARVTREQQPRNLFEQLFGALGGGFGDEDFIEDGFAGFGDYHTVRTVCVRLSDGYFWPVSYSTLPDFVANDAAQCQEQCPGAQVDLYYYDNPGQEAEQMVNLNGQAYTSLPNAFRYRTEFDKTASCRPAVNYGSIALAESAGGLSRAVIEFNGLSFPLPLRDPRRSAPEITQAPLQTAEYVSVPLPRRRPAAPGEQPLPQAVPVAADTPIRIVKFGDKRVRIVGPDTPYAPTAEAGT